MPFWPTSLCLPVLPPLCPHCLSLYPSIHPSIHSTILPRIHPFFCLSQYLSTSIIQSYNLYVEHAFNHYIVLRQVILLHSNMRQSKTLLQRATRSGWCMGYTMHVSNSNISTSGCILAVPKNSTFDSARSPVKTQGKELLSLISC